MLRRFHPQPQQSVISSASRFLSSHTQQQQQRVSNLFFAFNDFQSTSFRSVTTTTTTKVKSSSSAASSSSGKSKVDPKVLPPPTLKDKIKKELWLVLKLNLVLVPILVLGSLYFYPPQNPKKEQELMDLYKKSAGWKT